MQIDENSKTTIKITYEEYLKLARMIIGVMKDFQIQGEENVRQGDLVEKIVQHMIENGDGQASVEWSLEISNKISNIVHFLVTRENILMIT
jgi:hypothetical protein